MSMAPAPRTRRGAQARAAAEGGRPEAFDPNAALAAIRRRSTLVPRVALVLGSGLGVLAEGVAWETTLATDEIVGLPRSTVPGHAGRLLLGRWAGRPVVVAQGRSHLYEGYTAEEVTRVVRLVQALGARSLVLTNAAGGIAARMTPGTIMLVEDQVNLQWRSPTRTAASPRGLASRSAYSEELLAKAARAATVAGVRVERGVLGVVLGPSYETPAEIDLLERMGADAVCMSTAPETAMANALALPVAALSCITNWAAGRGVGPLAHAEVTSAVGAAAPSLKGVLERLILALA